jgi:hypothetical protein
MYLRQAKLGWRGSGRDVVLSSVLHAIVGKSLRTYRSAESPRVGFDPIRNGTFEISLSVPIMLLKG